MIVAVDTGGTKTLVAVFNTDGQIVAEEKFPTPTDISDYITTLCNTIDHLMDGQAMTCLSIALPGTVIDGRMAWAGNLPWHDIDMHALLASRYTCPIVVENDANLAGLGEARMLKDIPRVCLYVTFSTGVGTGIITNGQIDPNFSTNEGGQIVLEHEGTFKRWESFASGKALHEKYGKLASEIDDENVWNEIGLNVARGLLATSALIRPDIVIIGGGVGTHFDKFRQPLMSALTENTSDKYIPTIVRAAYPEEAVVYGCYYHALDSVAA
jgi:predicted NBD/HSP70 family sugar kinase